MAGRAAAVSGESLNGVIWLFDMGPFHLFCNAMNIWANVRGVGGVNLGHKVCKVGTRYMICLKITIIHVRCLSGYKIGLNPFGK